MLDFRLIRHLWYFVAVAEEKHFGRAAGRLGISQPPLTQQIQILERTLGVPLFERSRKGALLTREGAAIFNSVQSLLDHVQQVERAVRDAGRGASTTLVIGSIGTGLFDILPTVVRRARRRFPDLSVSIVEMHSADALPGLQNREIDLALARIDAVAPPMRLAPILEERLLVALPAGHRLATRKQIRLAELAEDDFVVFPRRVSASYFDRMVAACRASGFSPHISYEASSVVAQMAFVECGIAVSLVPPSAMRFAGAEVVFRPLRERIAMVTVAAVWNPERCHPLADRIVEIAVEAGRTRRSRRERPATTPARDRRTDRPVGRRSTRGKPRRPARHSSRNGAGKAR